MPAPPGFVPPVWSPEVGQTAAGEVAGPGTALNEALVSGAPAAIEQALADAGVETPVVAGPAFEMQVPSEVQTMADVPAGGDLRDFGGDLGGGDVAMAAAAVGLPVVAGGSILLSRLLAMLPLGVRSAVAAAIRALGGLGARVGWNRLPAWVQQLLIFAGVTAGLDILIDTGPDDIGAIQLPGTTDFSFQQMAGISVVGSWTANGVQFVKLSDGRLGARNKRGMWKFWRPKKPIVLFASGARDINTFLRADAVLDRQAKRLKKVISRRSPNPKRGPKAVDGRVIAIDGQKIIRNG